MSAHQHWLNRLRRKSSNRSFRHPSEAWAAEWLQQQGLQLLTCNYAIRGGELDLVMQDCAVTVFVEVRYRQHSQHGSAAASIDAGKQQKLLRAARHYLQQHGGIDSLCRFDVLSLDRDHNGNLHWQWHRNAFGEN